MRLGGFHKHRRLASAVALLGVLLYTALVPGHVISQATAVLFDDEPGAVLEMSCHDDMAHGPATPAEPTAPQKKCPFCKGYAPFMTAIAGASDAGTLEADLATVHFALLDEDQAQRVATRPHNRGPPLEL